MKCLPLNHIEILRRNAYYQFFLGFLTENQTFINHIWNEYINVEYKPKVLLLDYTAMPCEWFNNADSPCKKEGFIVENSWDVLRNGEDYEPWVIRLIQENIDHEQYVKVLGDAYYLPGNDKYKVKHAYRNLFIIGYDDDSFLILNKNIAGEISVANLSYEIFLDFIRKNEGIGNKYRVEIDFYKVNQEKSYAFNINKIKKQLSCYLNPPLKSETQTGRIAVENASMDILNHLIDVSSKANSIIDFLLDYRELMYRRMMILAESTELSSIISAYRHNMQQWEKIFEEKITDSVVYRTLLNEEIHILDDLLDAICNL